MKPDDVPLVAPRQQRVRGGFGAVACIAAEQQGRPVDFPRRPEEGKLPANLAVHPQQRDLERRNADQLIAVVDADDHELEVDREAPHPRRLVAVRLEHGQSRNSPLDALPVLLETEETVFVSDQARSKLLARGTTETCTRVRRIGGWLAIRAAARSERLPHDQRHSLPCLRGFGAGFGSQREAQLAKDRVVPPPHLSGLPDRVGDDRQTGILEADLAGKCSDELEQVALVAWQNRHVCDVDIVPDRLLAISAPSSRYART